MSVWTVSLDRPVVVEPPNAVAYVTFTSDDNRTVQQRIPYGAEVDLLKYLARRCVELAALDQRNADMATVVSTATVTPGAPIKLPDISKDQTLQAAQVVLQTKVNAALNTKQINDATVIDPTVATAKAAVDAAQAADVGSVQAVVG